MSLIYIFLFTSRLLFYFSCWVEFLAGCINKTYNLLFIFKFVTDKTLKMICLGQITSISTYRYHVNKKLHFASYDFTRWVGKGLCCIGWFAAHCIKSIRIRSYSGPHIPHIFTHSDLIQNAEKIRTRITPNIDTFYPVLVKVSWLSG